MHPLLWRLRVAQGKLHQAQTRRGEAQTEFSAAQEEIQRLAANVPDESLRRDFVARARAMMPAIAAPSPAQIEKQKFGGLSAREREVAALIGRGKQNKEIANALVVGVRTVEAHITRILNKLGFSSRTQIAVWAVEQGLARAPGDDAR
jgi:DNA-binding NarL/FixJ family response regulator